MCIPYFDMLCVFYDETDQFELKIQSEATLLSDDVGQQVGK